MPRITAPNIDLTGLVGRWRFRESDYGTTTLTNEVAGGQNFTLTNPDWQIKDGRRCLSFAGAATATSYGTITVTSSDLLSFPLNTVNELTVIAIVSSTGNGGNGFGRVMSFGGVGELMCRSNSLRLNVNTASGNSDWEEGGQTVFAAARPAVVAMTYNASDNTVRNIVNGVQVATLNTGVGGAIDGSSVSVTLKLGAQTSNASQFAGYIYEIAIFKKQLSAADTLTFTKMRKRVL